MKEIIRCGFVTSYINNLVPELNSSSNYDNNLILKSLSDFELEIISSTNPIQNFTQEETQFVYILDNLLSRGFPTLCSIDLERKLTNSIESGFLINELNVQGSIKFSDDINNILERNGWRRALTNTLLLFDPEFDSSIVFDGIEKEYNTPNNITVSQEERKFYCEILPGIIGLRVSQLFEPQRKIESMLPPNEAQNYFGQRVDFAIETVDSKVVIEIDGSQHFTDPVQLNLDTQRRNSLRSNGWKIIEITASEVNNNLSNTNLDVIQNILTASNFLSILNQTEPTVYSITAKQLLLTPFYVARFQKSVLFALKRGYLNFQQTDWRFCIIEEDLTYANHAVEDLTTWLNNLAHFFNIQLPAMSFRTVKFIEKFESFSDNEILFYISLDKKWTNKEKQYLETIPNTTSFIINSVFKEEDNFKLNSTYPYHYTIDEDNTSALTFLLQSIFRKEKFWEGQLDILKRSLALNPVIGLLPTGAGKSLTYQLSALLQPGVSLVVDPLRSLMFDQADNLSNYLIGNISFINSELNAAQRAQVINEMANGKYHFVFIAPERFQDNNFRSFLVQMTVSFSVPYLVIDEAHCVSEWGHDFRTSYLNLAKTAKRYCAYQNYEPTVLALTGTASYSVLTDVQREIEVDDEEAKIYPPTFDRRELFFDIQHCNSANKRDVLSGILRNNLPQRFNINENHFFQPVAESTKSGLIFVPWTNHDFGYRVRDYLQNQLNINVGFFSGSVPNYFQPNLHPVQRDIEWNSEKRRTQNNFKNNEFSILVSTKAFGMGIDKSNIRYTIHFGIPPSLEAFYQEAGRAGRDRSMAYNIIIFSDDNATIADQYLDMNLSAQDLRTMRQQGQWPQFGQEGDIHRMLFFHMNAFQGVDVEINYLSGLLTNHIYPIFNNLQAGQTYQEIISRNASLDKSIYRLTILGIISDYTINWNANQYNVILKKLTDEEILENLRVFIGRYKTPEYITAAEEVIQAANGANMLEKCLGYVVRFAYNEIEKKRRAALKTIAEVARSSSQIPQEERNNYIREQLLAYLEKSVFSDPLLEMVRSNDQANWWEILDQVTDIDLARQLLGACRRTIESYPEYPGLYILSAFARLLLPNYTAEQAYQDFETGIKFLVQQYEVETQEDITVNIINTYQRRIGRIHPSLGVLLLKLFESRKIARLLYPSVPSESILFLLSLLSTKLKNFNKHFIGD